MASGKPSTSGQLTWKPAPAKPLGTIFAGFAVDRTVIRGVLAGLE